MCTTLAGALYATGAAQTTPWPADRGGPGLTGGGALNPEWPGPAGRLLRPSVRRRAPYRRFARDVILNMKWRLTVHKEYWVGIGLSFVSGHGCTSFWLYERRAFLCTRTVLVHADFWISERGPRVPGKLG